MGARLDPDPFLNELHRMYERARTKGSSVRITLKRSNLKPKPAVRKGKPTPAPPPAEDYRCLVRASDGKRSISTTAPVPPQQAAKFAGSLNIICRAHMGELKAPKKREKEKKDKGGSKGGEQQQ